MISSPRKLYKLIYRDDVLLLFFFFEITKIDHVYYECRWFNLIRGAMCKGLISKDVMHDLRDVETGEPVV